MLLRRQKQDGEEAKEGKGSMGRRQAMKYTGTKNGTKAYYDSIARGYDGLHRDEQLRKMAAISRFLPEKALVLDVGCGTGLSAALGKVVGVDPSRGMLLHSKMPVVQGAGEHLPFKDNSVDASICVTSLHNFFDYGAGIKEMERVSRGAIIISALKKARAYAGIEACIMANLVVERMIDSRLDMMFVCRKKR